MPPTPTQRPLRPPPHQPWALPHQKPWVPPYHHASQERKMNLLRWAFFTFFALLVLYPSARVISSLNVGYDASIVEGYRVQKEGTGGLRNTGKGNGIEMLIPSGGGALEGILGEGRGFVARLIHPRDIGRLSERAGSPSDSERWEAFQESTDNLMVYLESIAKEYELGLWGLGKKEWDEKIESLMHWTTEEIGRLCLQLADCTERDVENAVQKTATELQKLKNLVRSPNNDRLLKRKVPDTLWVDFEQQTETLGNTMDAYAKSLALTYPPKLARELWAQEADTLISTNSMQFRSKCAAAEGCTVGDGEIMVQKMTDRINKSTSFIPSPKASTSMKRKQSPENEAAADQLVFEWMKKTVRTTVERFGGKLEAAEKAENKKSAEQVDDETIDAIGKDTDRFAQGIAKLGVDHTYFNTAVEQFNDIIDEACRMDKTCDKKRPEKLRSRLQKSALFLISRDISPLTRRALSAEEWAEMEHSFDSIEKIAHSIAASETNETTRKALAENWLREIEQNMPSCDQLIASGNNNWKNCTDQDIATFYQKMADRVRKAAGISDSREASPPLKRTLPPENWAFAAQNIDQFGKATDKLAEKLANLGLPSRNAFDATVEEWIRVIDGGSREQCHEIKGCNEEDLATIRQKLEDRARKSASVLNSRDASALRKRYLSPDHRALNDLRIEELRADIKKQAMLANEEGTTSKFYEFTAKAAYQYENNVMVECVETEGCTMQDAKEEIEKLNVLYKSLIATRDVQGGDTAGHDFFEQSMDFESQLMGPEYAEKRSDGVLLPFSHSKKLQVLPESLSQNEKRDDDAFILPDLEETAETNEDMDPDMDQNTNQTIVGFDCTNDPTMRRCLKPKETDLAVLTKWGPWSIMFAIIGLLLLLLILKCCTACYHPRLLIPDETYEPSTPTKSTSQPLLGASTRPNDEEAQMTEIPPIPMCMDGASDQEGWARKWISSKRGNELNVNKRANASIPLMEPKRSVRAPRIPSLQLPKAIFHTMRVASGLGTSTEGEMKQKRGKWGSTL